MVLQGPSTSPSWDSRPPGASAPASRSLHVCWIGPRQLDSHQPPAVPSHPLRRRYWPRVRGQQHLCSRAPTCLGGRSSWCSGGCGRCSKLCHRSLWPPPTRPVAATPSSACQASLHAATSSARGIMTMRSSVLCSSPPPAPRTSGLGHANNP